MPIYVVSIEPHFWSPTNDAQGSNLQGEEIRKEREILKSVYEAELKKK